MFIVASFVGWLTTPHTTQNIVFISLHTVLTSPHTVFTLLLPFEINNHTIVSPPEGRIRGLELNKEFLISPNPSKINKTQFVRPRRDDYDADPVLLPIFMGPTLLWASPPLHKFYLYASSVILAPPSTFSLYGSCVALTQVSHTQGGPRSVAAHPGRRHRP